MNALSRSRLGWWVYVATLAALVALIGHRFIDLLTLGLFGYYATRPISDRVDSVVESDRLAATVTVLTVLLPVFLVAIYAGFQILRQVRRRFDDGIVTLLTDRFGNFEAIPGSLFSSPQRLLANPPSLAQLTQFLSGPRLERALGLLGTAFDTLLLLALATTLAYALLRYDDVLAEIFAALVGGRETTAYTYALAVDDDLESVFYGNLLFVLAMSVVATAAYAATNALAPPGLQVPLVLPLGFLTGLASLIPVVVGKVIYLPVVAYLGLSAMGGGGRGLPFVAGVLVGYFVLLDILPQTFLQPYVTGHHLNTLILLFAYILGPIFFGWYGFFLMPIVFVLVVEVVRIVLPELLHGESIDPTADVAEQLGAPAGDLHEDTTDGETESANEDGSAPQD
ncbi:AI-2E family transporter [Haloarcula salinisoli]|uniref:AI-2E family transporter n=1 Tax=Haloarcula salinisoli TaxID=2487746 RepID=A0A8J7YF72_9EURY|nr:AI-2E family transporter [Halomicroarcula salinisoli]MBX0286289.1 AI-2E family transporter [Halomicroarcula salinisoli]MBX0302223.1 AI-2E family transporter [Halomicroarcula salinisoli]